MTLQNSILETFVRPVFILVTMVYIIMIFKQGSRRHRTKSRNWTTETLISKLQVAWLTPRHTTVPPSPCHSLALARPRLVLTRSSPGPRLILARSSPDPSLPGPRPILAQTHLKQYSGFPCQNGQKRNLLTLVDS